MWIEVAQQYSEVVGGCRVMEPASASLQVSFGGRSDVVVGGLGWVTLVGWGLPSRRATKKFMAPARANPGGA